MEPTLGQGLLWEGETSILCPKGEIPVLFLLHRLGAVFIQLLPGATGGSCIPPWVRDSEFQSDAPLCRLHPIALQKIKGKKLEKEEIMLAVVQCSRMT